VAYRYEHQVRFHETDAAGVVYFTNGLVLCHVAYEASLAAAGLNLTDFFRAETLAYPLVHASMDYYRPLHSGDRVTVDLTPTRVDDSSFEIHYQVLKGDRQAAQATTRHVCITVASRSRQPLPQAIEQWLERWGKPREET
jgi:1,4-dihydroxy-2-naphthoyl-CoA hydrolase